MQPAPVPKSSVTVSTLPFPVRAAIPRLIVTTRWLGQTGWDARERHCVEGKHGRKLLRKSAHRTRKHEVQKSATVLINDEVVW